MLILLLSFFLFNINAVNEKFSSFFLSFTECLYAFTHLFFRYFFVSPESPFFPKKFFKKIPGRNSRRNSNYDIMFRIYNLEGRDLSQCQIKV